MSEPGANGGAPSVQADVTTEVDQATAEFRVPDAYPSAPRHVLPPPSSIGRYTMIERLGSGGMGVVYLAYDPGLDRRVAVKVVHEGGRRWSINARPRLVREAQALARLAHPNVVSIYDVGTVGRRVFIAMEHVDGQTLGEWLRGAQRSLGEIIDVFSAAGRGLAAAHAAGLVHRDFKPDNVLIGKDGRVCVVDFGLAVLTEVDEVDEITSPSRTGTEEIAFVQTRLTATGQVMGTPAYMAPEQHFGETPDARSDQWSFCVALYEALYGERPFVGRDQKELARSTVGGVLPDAPPEREVPRALRTVLARALRPDPDQRWPSMVALLRALRNRRRSALRRALPAVGTVALAAAGLGGWALNAEAEDAACSEAAVAASEVWNEARHRSVHEALLATDVSYAEPTWRRVAEGLDAYAAHWAELRESACDTDPASGRDDAIEPDLQNACLSRRLTALQATIDVLALSDAATVERAASLVAGLPSLGDCEDANALALQVAPPDDASTAAQVEALRKLIVEAHALENAGQYEAAEDLARVATQQAATLDYPPAHAEALLQLGRTQVHQAKHEQAEVNLSAAALIAIGARHDTVAVDALTQVTSAVGYLQARREAGLAWARHARAVASRAPIGVRRRAKLLNAVGSIHTRAGQYTNAQTYYQRAVAVLEGADEPDAIKELAASLNNLGNMHGLLGDIEAAAVALRRSAKLMEQVLGPEHPKVAIVIANAANVDHELGRFQAARTQHERALQIRRRALGPRHPLVASSLGNLGLVRMSMGDFGAALTHLEEAAQMRREAFGPEHPDYALTLNNLGDVYRELGQHDRAMAINTEALRIWDEAAEQHHPLAVYPHANMGLSHLALGDLDTARRFFERALQLHAQFDVEPGILAITRFGLARTLWQAACPAQTTDCTRALRLARDARDGFETSAGRYAKQLREIESWLDAKG